MSIDEIILSLASWELLGDRRVCPKEALRKMALDDLSEMESRLGEKWEDFMTPKMVRLEKRYRLGLLRDDWALEEVGKNVLLRYSPLRPGHAPVMLDLVSIGELG